MNKLLREFLSYILFEETPAERAKKMGLTYAEFGRWKNSQGIITHKTEGDSLVPVSPTDATADEKPAERIGSTGDVGLDKGKKKTKKSSKKKPAVTSAVQIPPDASNQDIQSNLAEMADLLHEKRLEGIGGAGGAVPSYGEEKTTQTAQELMGASDGRGLVQGISDYRERHREAIDRIRPSIQEKLGARTRKGEPKETRLRKVCQYHGIDADTDSEAAVELLAMREAHVEAGLAELKNDPNSLFHKCGKQGFCGDEKAAREWLETSFDSALATARAATGSKLDLSRPHRIIQSDPGEGGVNSQSRSILESRLASAEPGSEEAKHYEEQLKMFDALEFRDTMVIGEDSNGRLVIFSISNKADSDLRDTFTNTQPVTAFRDLTERFRSGLDTLEDETEREAVKRMVVVTQEAADDCADAGRATVRSWAKIDSTNDELVDAIHELQPPPNGNSSKDYLGDMAGWMDSPVGPRSSPSQKEFQAWKDGPGKETVSRMQAACGSDPRGRACTQARIATLSEYMATNPQYSPPADTVGRIITKVGEIETARRNRGASPRTGLDTCVETKQAEKDAVEAAHKHVVTSAKTEDDKICKANPDRCKNEDGSPRNGPNTQAAVEATLERTHFGMFIDNFDGHMAIVAGGREVTPSDFRESLAERTGYTPPPDITTPEGRTALREHVARTCDIDAETGELRVVSGMSSGQEPVVIASSIFRTAGTTQKVGSFVGSGLVEPLTSRSDARARESSGDLSSALISTSEQG